MSDSSNHKSIDPSLELSEGDARQGLSPEQLSAIQQLVDAAGSVEHARQLLDSLDGLPHAA